MLKLNATFELPRRLRTFVRARELSRILLAAVVGAIAGLVVTIMGAGVDVLHSILFGLDPGERLSGRISLNPQYALLTPCLGGVLFGLASTVIARRRGAEVDPIEANALHGGHMSMRGSLIVAAQTVWSSGIGASVGLEAGYTQLAGGIASRLGQAFHLRRGDLRLLVGCGAAGAIAGAFSAPLAGAFYAFELIIGSYSVTDLAPVGLAALIGYLTTQAFTPLQLGIHSDAAPTVAVHDLVAAAGVGVIAAIFGIALMRGVAFCEDLLASIKLRPWLRPALGGALVGLLAIVSPQVMSSGHGALRLTGLVDLPIQTVAIIFALKSLASIISLGAGFRGGLFFASLLLGALGGQLFAAALSAAWPDLNIDSNIYAIIGMSALAASVIGGPLTMVFIALESTGDLWLASAALIAVIISAQVTRELFGYSFATWRFHLRGETIHSAADVGWIRDLTVGRMMRTDVPTASADTILSSFRLAFPLGSTSHVIAVDGGGRFAGIVAVPEAHVPELSNSNSIRQLLQHAEHFLIVEMTIQEAINVFDRAEAEELAVVESNGTRRVVGLLNEAYALRRYTAASDLRRRELTGTI